MLALFSIGLRLTVTIVFVLLYVVGYCCQVPLERKHIALTID